MDNEFKPEKGHEELPEWLVKLKQQGDGMKVPEGYFEKFPDTLMDKIAGQNVHGRQEAKVAQINLRRVISWTMAAAASLLLMVMIWNQDPTSEPEQLASLNDLPVEDAMAYLIDNTDDYSWQDIVEEGMSGDVEGLQRLGLEQLSDDVIINELDEEHILDLL